MRKLAPSQRNFSLVFSIIFLSLIFRDLFRNTSHWLSTHLSYILLRRVPSVKELATAWAIGLLFGFFLCSRLSFLLRFLRCELLSELFEEWVMAVHFLESHEDEPSNDENPV